MHVSKNMHTVLHQVSRQFLTRYHTSVYRTRSGFHCTMQVRRYSYEGGTSGFRLTVHNRDIY